MCSGRFSTALPVTPILLLLNDKKIICITCPVLGPVVYLFLKIFKLFGFPVFELSAYT
jgi:hypothetical protein